MSVGWGGMVIGHGWWATGATTSGKSAVQLLQESKSRYVKSDRVLVTHQEPSRPDRFHISANPNIFLSAPSHTLHVSRPPAEAPVVGAPPPVPPRTHVIPLTSVALALHGSGGSQSCGVVPPPLPSRSPRVAPRPRAKTQPVGDILPRGGDLRRSLSHGPADRSNDVQMKLRRLLYTDSKESLLVEGTPEHCKGRRGSKESPKHLLQKDHGTFRAEVAAVTIHKSLPDLFLEKAPTEKDSQYGNDSGYRRPSCPGAIRLNSPPTPPPRPPRISKCSPPKVPARPPARPPPPKFSTSYIPTSSPDSIPNGCLTSESDLSTPDESGEPSWTEETRYRRPIFRSKSDVTHERPGTAGTLRWEEESRRGSFCSTELEEFYNSMGLDGSTLRSIESPLKTGGGSPVYFEEVTSEESGTGLRRGSSDSDEMRIPPMSATGCRLLSKRTGEPSIIEKNARVIKWLFNCQKARAFVILPRSLSSGS